MITPNDYTLTLFLKWIKVKALVEHGEDRPTLDWMFLPLSHDSGRGTEVPVYHLIYR